MKDLIDRKKFNKEKSQPGKEIYEEKEKGANNQKITMDVETNEKRNHEEKENNGLNYGKEGMI